MEALRPAVQAPVRPLPTPPARPTVDDRVELGTSSDETVPARLAEALRRCGKSYYDAGADQKAQRAYYGGLSGQIGQLSSDKLFWRLSQLVTETHQQNRSYDPDEYLYKWVDLRPNLRLNCIYDPNPVATNAPVRGQDKDFEVKQAVGTREVRKKGRVTRQKTVYQTRSLREQAQQWSEALSRGPGNALQIAQQIAEIETRSVFNCEHVVPRIWFQDRTPMRGDLHHLFTANQATNGQRSSRRLFDFPEYDGSDGKGYAPYHDDRYEPAAGKGAVARATLYFLLRYPRKIGDDPRELRPEDLATLLRWNRENPPTLWERHRNVAIADLQGNRNPFIDHPDWADRVDFTQGLQRPLPEGMRAERPQKSQSKKRPQRQERPRPQSTRRTRRNRRWRR